MPAVAIRHDRLAALVAMKRPDDRDERLGIGFARGANETLAPRERDERPHTAAVAAGEATGAESHQGTVAKLFAHQWCRSRMA